MSGALDTAWRTLAVSLNVGRALVAALSRAGVGLLVGLVLFTVIAQLAPPEYRGLARNVGALLTALAFGVNAFRKALRPPDPSDVMGSAAWADPRQVAAALAAPALAADPAALLVGRGDGKPGPLLRYNGPAHLLTVAPTRSGKGVGTILPNLLLANRPVICVDPKGENARITARARRRFGPVFVLDSFGASGQPSASYVYRIAIIGAWDRNHRTAVPEIIATGLRGLAQNHCTRAHKGCNWDRNHRGPAHADCTGRQAWVGQETTGLLPTSEPCPKRLGRAGYRA